MIQLLVHNDYTTITGVDQRLLKIIDLHTSYHTKNYKHSKVYKAHAWDGKDHLLRYNRNHGYHFPTGLLADVVHILNSTNSPHVIEDNRSTPNTISIKWSDNNITLRDYQQEAIRIATTDGMNRGRLILKMPIRSGKTLTAAKIISEYSVRALFIVNSEMLLNQTIKVFQKHFQTDIGQVGSGVWERRDITVATIQTLVERGPRKAEPGKKAVQPTPEFVDLMANVDLIFFDECHHLEAKLWKDILLHSNARYRIGLSATAYLAPEGETERGTIWLKACCGPISYEVSASHLIQQGYLVPLDVIIIPIRTATVKGKWPLPYESGIINNMVRNAIIINKAMELSKNGLVLIHAIRLDHISILSEMLDTLGAKHHVMIGETSTTHRRQRVAEFQEGTVRILLGNLFGEGVDIPECDCVINAAGGKSEISTMQRIRNLTTHDGKHKAVLIDFADLQNKYLADHALERIHTYKTEPMFNIKVNT